MYELSNILIYGGNTKVEYQAVIKIVLHQYVEHGFAVNVLESDFRFYKSIFLRYVIKSKKVKLDPLSYETMFK